MNELKSLSRVRAHARCPQCGSARLRRSSKPQKDVVTMDNGALWELNEACTMCAWDKTMPNVKIGV